MSRFAHFAVGAAPVESAEKGAQAYKAARGMDPRPSGDPFTFMPRSVHEKIAAAFRALPGHDDAALPAYRAMRDETNRQFDHLTGSRAKGGMGIHVTSVEHDPYGSQDWTKTFSEIRHDVTHNHRLDVLSTKVTGGVPGFTDEENDKFRAVHDVFGHLASGRGVDFHGEDAAWKHHVSMYTPLAQKAVSTQLRGFTSEQRMQGLGNFPQNKVGILPALARDPNLYRMGSEHERSIAREQALKANRSQGIIRG